MKLRTYHVPTMGNDGVTIARQSYIYAIRMGWDGPIKIGRSYSSDFRLRDLQVGNPYELQLLGTVLETDTLNEQTEHQRLHTHRMRGEWFDITTEHLPWVTHAVQVMDLTPKQRTCPECNGAGTVVEALTLGQAARQLGVTVGKVRQLINAGEIVAGRIGQTLMVEQSDLNLFTDA